MKEQTDTNTYREAMPVTRDCGSTRSASVTKGLKMVSTAAMSGVRQKYYQ